MAAVRNYKYKKLNRNGSEIRLLEVCPAEGVEDRLKCRLVNVKPIDDLEFIGLSAVAGDFSKTETIVLNNNQRVAIPADLGEALRHLRAALQPDQLTTPAWLTHLWKGMRDLRQDQSGKLLVWTAELCVNPHDPQEQAGRREHMRLAYRKAKMVVGWLGPRDETSDTAVEIIRTIDRAMPANFGLPDDKLKHPENYAPRCEWLDELKWFWEVPAGLDDPRDSLVFRSISQFMSRPYLQSDWVLQEIAMATCPSFLVGDKMISWKQMLRFLRNNEDLVENGATMFPDEFRDLIQFLPLGAIYTLLKDFGDAQHSVDSLLLGPTAPSTRLSQSSSKLFTPDSSSNSIASADL